MGPSLCHVTSYGATELGGKNALMERDFQQLIESQVEGFLGVRFLATEYSTGKMHKRIKT